MSYNGLSKQRKDILDVIKKLGQASPNDIQQATDGEIGNIHQQLTRLSRDDFIKRKGTKAYTLTDKGISVYEPKMKVQKTFLRFSEDEIKSFERFARDKDFYAKLGEVCLPKLFGLEKEKLGCVLSLVSLPDKEHDRNRIHVLLEGGPGSGKTTLIEGMSTEYWGFFADSIRVSKSTLAGSAKGSVYKEGLLQMADMSVLAIDEIDKLELKDQRALLGAMSRGKLTINQDGVVNKETDTRVRVMATCNGMSGLIPELKSRFDLIFTMKKLTPDDEAIMIKNMVENWGRQKNIFTGDFFKKYLQYVNMFESDLPEDREWIYQFLVEENRFGSLQKKDNRNKETILRLSMVIARLRLEKEVKKEHVQKAIELLGD